MNDAHDRDRRSRRGFLRTLGAAGTAAVAGTACTPAQPPAPTGAAGTGPGADEVVALVNGRIHTMDAQNTVADSVVLRNGVFAAVGNSTAPPAGAHVVDLGGRAVVPGLTEPHVHIVSLANRPGYHTILENTTSIRDVQEALAARRKDVPEGQWLTSMGGWHTNQWAEHRYPTRAELDDSVPDRPVFLYDRFTGPCAVNTLAKQFFDAMDADTPVHPDIQKINVSDDGAIAAAAFGRGGPSASALYLLRRMQTFDDKKRSTQDAMRYSAEVGLTAHLDQTLFPTPGPLHPSQILSNLDQYKMYDPWLALHREGRASVRLQINFLSNQTDPALPELHERLRNQFQFFGDDWVRTGSIGEWAAPISAGPAWLEAQRVVAEAQWRNENAVQTLAQLQQVVEAYEQMNARYGISNLRWCVHHVPEVTPELLSRLQAMGVGVQMGAYRWVTSSDPNQVVGPAFRTIVDHGIQVGIHGDGVHIAPLNPWQHIHYATTGLNSFGQQVNAGQQLMSEEALRLFTRSNPWFLRMEDKIGSIEPGKLADLVVLDRDYFAVSDADLKKIRSVLTIVGGKTSHSSGALAI